MRIAHCLWTHHAGSVDLLKRGDDPRFVGVQTCGSVWSCPVCSAKISEVRRRELVQLQEWASKRGLIPMMMTLTARHRRRALKSLVDSLAKAKQRLWRRKAWKRLGDTSRIVGTVSVREATYGDGNGWHPHYHVIVLLDAADEDEAARLLEPFRTVWLDCLRAEGLTGTARRAFDVRSAGDISEYPSKHGRDSGRETAGWDMAAEMTQARNKSGRRGGRSPFQILRDADAGDESSVPIWQEYARAMHGRRQMVWSNGLKAAAGVGEAEDEEIAEGEAFSEDEDEMLARWSPARWRQIRHLRGEIMTAGRHEGAVGIERVLVGIDGEPPPGPLSWRPRPGGLVARSLSEVRKPQKF